MTQDTTQAPFPLAQGKGALASHFNVIASYDNDMGCSIGCGTCGHEFVASKPLSDESQPADSIELAKAIWFHRCEDEGRRYREVERRARITKHRP